MSNWIALLLLAACSSAPAIELPNGSPGIGFDDLRFSARLHRVLVPGGRSGNLALIDPSAHAITTIGGFSTTTSFDSGSHDFGITSVDDLGGLLVQTRGRAFTHLWDGGTVAVDVRTLTVGPRWSNGCNDSRGIAIDEVRGFVFAGCAEGRVTVLDAADGHKVSELWEVDGVDVIDFSPSRRHLYAPGQISANTAIIGVSTGGELGLLAKEDGTLYGHCVTTDDAGHGFVCAPRGGALLVIHDAFDAITR